MICTKKNICGVLARLLCVVCLWGASPAWSAAPPPSPTVPVRVALSREQNVPVFFSGLGTVTPSNTVLVKSRVDGQLEALHFKEGRLVNQGDLLATIDPRPFQVQLEQARGQLARDSAILENAKKDATRYSKLLKEDSISPQQASASASLVGQYEGIVQTDKAQVDAARLQLEYSRITAPISGRLGLRMVDPGNMIRASDTTGIVLITQVAPVDVVFPLSETLITDVLTALSKGKHLVAEAWDREQKHRLATGELLSLDNQIDLSTGTVKLKARFANPENTLFPNQFVNARLEVNTLENALTVPASAIQLDANGAFIYVVDPQNTVKIRPVNVVHRTNTLAVLGKNAPGKNVLQKDVLQKDVLQGDKVVIDGLDRLRDGVKVTFPEPTLTPDALQQSVTPPVTSAVSGASTAPGVKKP